MPPLSSLDIRRLLELLNDELRTAGCAAELYLVGGAVMCLAYSARHSTIDVDASFRPSAEVRRAAARVAARAGVEVDWLNDGVKSYLSTHGDYAPFLERDHLKVLVAQPSYLLAMKCLAFRIGEEFHDEADIRFLLRLLDIATYEKAVAVIGKYYPLDQFPPKTFYALAELLPKEE